MLIIKQLLLLKSLLTKIDEQIDSRHRPLKDSSYEQFQQKKCFLLITGLEYVLGEQKECLEKGKLGQ